MTELPVPRGEIESKEKGRTPTCWITIHYPVRDEVPFLRVVDEKMNAAGWVRDSFRPPPPFNGVAEIVYVSNGSAIFNGWTPAEYRRKFKAGKDALERIGLPVYRKRLTLADML